MNSAPVVARANARFPWILPGARRSPVGTGTRPGRAAARADLASMASVVASLLAPGKGILAADESLPTIEKRFHAAGLTCNEESRRDYREMLFTTPGLGEAISGVILFDETIRQQSSAGILMPELLSSRGIIPGIKVDKGTMALPGFDGEKITVGLDGLRERLAEYRQLGARFTKWRAVIAVDKRLPTTACLGDNARALAFFAALSQEAGLVPIVEPEVLMAGNHTLARCEEVMDAILNTLFAALVDHRVELETLLLKTGMVLPGDQCGHEVTTEKIAEATLRCLRRAVPAAVPGIVFLSGGQSSVAATERLDAICRLADVPWKLSFSFGRALQDAPLAVWNGSPANREDAQAALRLRATCNGLAVQGKY
jgi:fructose-bisphosphate aldolase class I